MKVVIGQGLNVATHASCMFADLWSVTLGCVDSQQHMH